MNDEQLWLAFIYNCRGYEMTPMVWEKFRDFIEARKIHLRNPEFTELAGGTTTNNVNG